MQVYLPEDLHRQVKEQKLPVSELLQQTLRAELDRRKRIAGIRDYLAELEAELGPPSAEDMAWAKRMVAQILGQESADDDQR